jgi:hypothetical protein
MLHSAHALFDNDYHRRFAITTAGVGGESLVIDSIGELPLDRQPKGCIYNDMQLNGYL